MATVRIHSFVRALPQVLERLQRAHTSDLANVLGRAAVVDPALRTVWRGARVLGLAFTVKCSPGDNLGALVALLEASPGDVLVVQAGDGEPTAIAGAIAVRVARERKLAGMVIDGAVRDVLDIEAMKFPTWARYVCPRQSRKDQSAEVGVPIECGGVTVAPGDIVMADDDGIVFASPSVMIGALDKLDAVLANEARCEDAQTSLEVLQGIVARTTIERV